MQRMLPVTAALQFLKGRRTIDGKVPFDSVEQAVFVLRGYTGQDFGTNANRWGEWLAKHRGEYRRSADDPLLSEAAWYFFRHGKWPADKLMKKKRRPRKPSGWQNASIRTLLELIQAERAADPIDYPKPRVKPPDPIRKGIPTLKKGVYRKPTPMIEERFLFAGQCKIDGIYTWLGLPDMAKAWTNPRIQKQINIRRVHWEESAPQQFPPERLSLFATEPREGEEIYLVWPAGSSKEPEVWTYFGWSENKYPNLREFLKWKLK
jgi:hypothetical protein